MVREIISIDENLCNGCGLCVPNCPEGAIKIVEGKARLVGDIYCDGLGACIGNCPLGAITIERREAEAYNERTVMENVVRQGPAVIRAHLEHLEEHGERELHREAIRFLSERGIGLDDLSEVRPHRGGCPGSLSRMFGGSDSAGRTHGEGLRSHGHGHAGGCGGGGCGGSVPVGADESASVAGSAGAGPDASDVVPSALTHWPVQLHLVSPRAPQYRDADVLLSADCVAFALGDFHRKLLSGRRLAIACPKLDMGKDAYLEKLVALIETAEIRSLTIAIMEVPCCGGLQSLAERARELASRKIPLEVVVVSVEGEILDRKTV